MKKLLSIILAILMIVTTIPFAFAADIVASGTHYAITWSLDSEGKLTIGGECESDDNFTSAPWKEYKNNIKTAVIENGVTSIPTSTFSDCRSLEKVTIPNSVTSIGNYAFDFCSSLVEINIPDSVTSIGPCAFGHCESLEEITIPDGVELIPMEAFTQCFRLKKVVLPDSVTKIHNDAFNSCYNLTEINIPDGISVIGLRVFDKCRSLTEITLPDSITTIGTYAFDGCTNLTKVNMSNSITTIADCAFRDCYKLSEITLPDSLTFIGEKAFINCKSLAKVTIPGSVEKIYNSAFLNCEALAELTIMNGVKYINIRAFEGCDGITEITIPDSVTYVGTDAFASCKRLKTVNLSCYWNEHDISNAFSEEVTLIIPKHDWSNKDGICANGCGYECPHESYTDSVCDTCGYVCPHDSYTDGVCDGCSYECPHEWGEGVLTRPVHDTVLGSKDGYYTYTCTVCDYEKKETVKGADYSAYEAVSEEINALLQSDELTDAAKQEIYSAANECGLLSDELTESEQNIVDDLVAELEKIVADAEEKIASGEYVKVDGFAVYNERGRQWLLKFNDDGVYEKANEIIRNLTDEANAKMEEMYAFALSLEGSVAENAENIAKVEADIDEFFGQIENCIEGVHNGFVYEVTEEAKCEVNAIESATCTLCGETDEREVEGSALEHSFTKYEETEAPKCGVAGKEVAYCDHGCQTTDERETPALEHIFLDYVSNGDATCTADGTKTASCIYGCGATDTVADEDTMLDHSDEDGDKICDDCHDEIKDVCPDCGRAVHEENGIAQYICAIIMFVKLVVSFVKMLQGAAA